MKRLDITEKLNFSKKPVLVVKDKEIEIDNSAVTILKVMGLMGDEAGSKEILEAYELLFDKTARKTVDSLQLNFGDFATLVREAIELAAGDSEGEQ
ncbi:hypothetical protein D1155_07900 [Anaerotruncus sp. 80]|uniref:Uncharacterized protein n=1 Tax=Anaerotruncus colihominis TaxID=169435 RepID=A0A845QHG4_9FIRM|nr:MULTISPECIES: hypothetical protein [Anaerotruncus]NBH61570.1 hypothetical protein [Anaerotruncus colihominis]NCF02225.1 hypothetical protein [Anaerotruncus sp. 80]